MFYRLMGWWIRLQACRMAAQVMQSQGMGTPEEGPCPKLWSSVVFFERYIMEGAEGTCDDFGPKEPVELKAVKPSAEAKP